MGVIQFKNYLASSRKPDMEAFGMFKTDSNLDWIAHTAGYAPNQYFIQARGMGVTDDTLAMQATIDAAVENSPLPAILTILPGVYKTSAPLDFRGASNLFVDGYGAIIMPSGNVGFDVIKSTGGSIVNLTTVASDVNYPNRELSTAASLSLTSATGLVAGDHVLLSGTETSHAFKQIVKINTLVSTTLTPYQSIRIPIQAIDTNSVAKITLGYNLVIRGLTIDGRNCIGSGTYNPISLSCYRDSKFIDLLIQNFSVGANTPGMITTYMKDCFYRSINVVNCGGGGGAAGFYIWWNTDCSGDQIYIRECNQFGFEPVQCIGLDFSNVKVIGVTGRAVKISGCGWSNFVNIEGSDSHTGVYVMTGSYNNHLTNVRGYRNQGGPGFGAGTSAEDNRNNCFDGVSALNNGDQDLVAGATDKHTSFLGISTLASTLNNGATGVIVEYLDGIINAIADTGTATANSQRCVITTESLTTAAGSNYSLNLINSRVGMGEVVLVSIKNGTNTQGIPVLGTVQSSTGSCQIVIYNLHATQAFNGTLKIYVNVDSGIG